MNSSDDVIETRAPGKLYVAGEYAVVEAGHAAVLISVDRFLTVRAKPAGDVGHITSTRFPDNPIVWRHRNGELDVLEGDRQSGSFMLSAIQWVEALVRESGRAPICFDLAVSSDLDDSSGRKFGLGSSAAVTVATVRALVGLYDLQLDDLELYKLAFLAAHAIQPSGSGGDIATATFAACIGYSSPDREWLIAAKRDAQQGGRTVHALLERPWPGLRIERLHVPDELSFLIGWTGAPASTPELVGKVQSSFKGGARHDSPEYQEFLDRSDRCVNAMKKAMTHGDVAGVQHALNEARQTLAYLTSITGTVIETPILRRLVEIAQEHGAAAKSSGAGGGDCGIALCGAAADQEGIREAWAKEGIQALDLTLYSSPEHAVSEEHADAAGIASQRKDDHVRLADRQHADESTNAFDDIRFIHHAFPDIATKDVDLGVHVLGADWPMPFFINAMTGGSSKSGDINAALAKAAARTGLAIASGSQHAALREPSLRESFTAIRDNTPGFVFANVGPSVTPDQAVDAVAMLQADALQIHVNAAQEIVMPEGDRDFSSWRQSIADIIAAVKVPVVVKEVGFGLSSRSIGQILDLGADGVDVSGRGGTDFVDIENRRRKSSEYSYLRGFGQSTPLCLLDAVHRISLHDRDAVLLASGGVRNPLDVLKALALGAQAVGVSGHFLHTYLHSGDDALVAEIEAWKMQLRSLMTLLGARSVADLRHGDVLITGESREEAELLGIDLGTLARRS
ncbi:MAG: phosphomevalonate kinase [Bifidobacterium psychraerophilum]|uniref:phosphomevalonate kinase n=1 Tax=Bifidobacterium psychraerophilum TaxID=218140 RepID=UPI0039EBCF75